MIRFGLSMKVKVLAAVAAVGLVGMAAAPVGTQKARRPVPRIDTNWVDLEREAAEASRRFIAVPYTDNVKKNLTAAARNLREVVAAELARNEPVPESRLQHFQWMAQQPFLIQGWYATVEEAALTPTGWSATIQVVPRTVTVKGSPVTVADPFIERYEFANGVLHFVQGHRHPNYAGGSYVID
jgi:hypothetical protein